MRRIKWLAFVTVVVMAFVLACGAAEQPAPTPVPPAPAQAPQPAPTVAQQAPQQPQQPAQPAPAPTVAMIGQPTPIVTVAPAPTVAVRPSPTPTGIKMGGTLRVVPQGSIAIIDPHNTGAIVTGYIGRNVYEQMFTPNSSYEPKPQLVDSWQLSSDEKVWTFKLRQGLSFHNGEPMRVEDVMASVVREAGRNPISRGLFRGFTADPNDFSKAFNKVDANTFTLTLTKPTGYLLTAMAQADPFMPSVMHQSIWSVKLGDPVRTAIGTGPWKFVEWVPGNRLVLEKFAGYKSRSEPYDFLAGAHQVYLDKLEIVEVPDHASRVAALRTGEVHYLDDFKLDLAKTLEGVPGVTVIKTRDGNLGTFGFNHTKPPFNDKRARQAVAYAVGVERLMSTAVGDQSWWKECPFFLHCGTFWSEKATGAGQQVQSRQGNIEKARQLVKEAGVEGMQVRILSSQDMPFMPEAALVMREVLNEIGFKAEVVAVDWATTVSRTQSAKPEDLETWEANTSWSNFANGVDPLAPHGIVRGSTAASWQDPEGKVAALRQQFMETTDVNRQLEIARQLDATFWEEVPSLNMGMFSPPRAYRNEVRGIRNYLFPLFFEVWINK